MQLYNASIISSHPFKRSFIHTYWWSYLAIHSIMRSFDYIPTSIPPSIQLICVYLIFSPANLLRYADAHEMKRVFGKGKWYYNDSSIHLSISTRPCVGAAYSTLVGIIHIRQIVLHGYSMCSFVWYVGMGMGMGKEMRRQDGQMIWLIQIRRSFLGG